MIIINTQSRCKIEFPTNYLKLIRTKGGKIYLRCQSIGLGINESVLEGMGGVLHNGELDLGGRGDDCNANLDDLEATKIKTGSRMRMRQMGKGDMVQH